MVFIASLTITLLIGQSAPPQNALRIVVIEGEDAVNVIQQKTAVAPVVEIRDRNNLPVAGVAVTFTVGGQGASFGGLSTLTVTTNAAGQAAAAGLTPTAAGAIQINAAALVQGQALTATITQTNVLTAAQAAGAAGATGGATGGSTGATGGAAGGAAGGGGGISGTTIGLVGAAVAGGAVAATQVAGGGDESTATGTAPPGPRIFRGAFASTITLNFQSCTRVETWVGTLEMAMPGDGSIDGNASITGGTTRVEAVTCTGGPQLGATGTVFMPVTPVTGTAANIEFTSERSNIFPPSGTDAFGGTNITGFRFSGALNGSEIAGTLTHTRRIENANPEARVPGTGSASVAITLRF